jgi:hypothetical protein
LLHLAFHNCPYPFITIHDCLLVPSCRVSQALATIRETFANMYREPVLEEWASQLGQTISPGIMKNTLDIDSVLDSTYFFC